MLCVIKLQKLEALQTAVCGSSSEMWIYVQADALDRTSFCLNIPFQLFLVFWPNTKNTFFGHFWQKILGAFLCFSRFFFSWK